MTPNNPLDTTILREGLLKKYNISRANLLLVALFTLVNILILIFTNGDGGYFLFSASVPYFIVVLGMTLSHRFPVEFYEELYGEEYATMEFLGTGFFLVTVVIAVLIIAVYAALYFLSGKNRLPFLIAALVLISVDSVAMFLLNGFDPSMIVDIIFHVWVIVSLAQGIRAGNALSRLPVVYTAVPTDTPNYFETKL